MTRQKTFVFIISTLHALLSKWFRKLYHLSDDRYIDEFLKSVSKGQHSPLNLVLWNFIDFLRYCCL